MNSQVNVRQTRLQTRAQQANVNPNPGDDDDQVSNRSSENSFIPSMVDASNRGELRECPGCDRPNNAERYMVECQKCIRWYHFSCANVDRDTVRANSFVCLPCNRSEVSVVLEPAKSVVSGISSSTSAQAARMARELQRLDEEKRIMEELSRERIERERALNERELQERMEREKQFLARKHELLDRQDDGEGRSVRSMRSRQKSVQRTEDWVQQTASEAIGPRSTSANAEDLSLGNPQGVHPSSTPLKIVDAVDDDGKSIPETLGSLTLGDIFEEPIEGAGKGNADQRNQLNLPTIDVTPYLDLLKLDEVAPTSADPKVKRVVPSYEQWRMETNDLRQQKYKALQERQKMAAELRNMQEMVRKLQWDIDTRGKREMGLENQLKNLQIQHAEELRIIHRSETSLQDQLRLRDQENACLKTQVAALNEEIKRDRSSETDLRNQLKQHEEGILTKEMQIEVLDKKLGEAVDRMRTSEAEWREQLNRRNQECEAFRLQQAELEIEIQGLRVTEEQLQSQLEVSRQREQEAIRQRSEAEQEYWDLHDEVQRFISRNEHWSANGGNSPPLPSPPSSWLDPTNASDDCPPFLPPPPPPPHSNSANDGLSGMSGGGIPQVPPNASGHVGPSPHQIAARQVVTKELPIFSGDPIDWPLFNSSYQHSTEACGYSNAENLLRLQRSLRGSAKESVSSFLLHPSTVPQVMSTLQQLYGRPEQIVNNMIAKVRATPPPKPDRLETLVSFGLVVQNLCGHLKAVGLERHLANPILLQELVDKLPATVKFNWALHQEQIPEVDLNVFSAYMAKISSAASGVTQLATIPQKAVKDERSRQKERSFVNTHVSTEQPKANRREEEQKGASSSGKQKEGGSGASGGKWCAVCSVDSHQIENCASFKGLDLDGKWKAVKANKLCARCLTSHAKWPCKGEVCGINDCPKRHHRLLHFDPPAAKTNSAVVTVHRQVSSSTLFRILPVTLFGKNGQFNTYAFLDDGSSVTLVERSIAEALGVNGEMETLHIEWTGGVNKTISGSEVVTMEISEVGGSKRYRLSEVYTVDNLGLPQQTTDYAELTTRFAHLDKLPVKSYRCAVPGILIGQSNCHLLATLKLREGRLNEPIATKTRIGWAVCGSLRRSQASTMHRQLHMYAEPSSVDLHEYVRRFFDVDSLGVAVVPAVKGVEEERAYKILEETTRRTSSGKFEVGLLWKYDYIEFPDSRPMAERRFKCLEKRLAWSPELYDSVRQQIADFKAKGYIHEATAEEIAEFDLRRTWHMPIGVVVNEKKPGRIRVIWDAAAKVDGVSLNSMLLKGPDLLTSLLYVLFAFREREVAVSADVKEMFLQMLVRARDRSALLFPYRDSPDLPMSTMVSDVAIFGAACSPAHSQYVKNLNATEQEAELPRGAEAVKKRHYVDDYVDSFDRAEEAYVVAKEVIEVHKRAGFHIRNWMSSDKSVLERLGEANVKPSKAMLPEKEIGFERVLGVAWIQEEDVFVFSLQFCEKVRILLDGATIPTKREMLRLVMSLYDPLGLVGSFVIHGKILIQEVWRTDTDWDSKIPAEIATRWMEWLTVLKNMTGLRIPRCYFPGYDPDSYNNIELHVFVDASAQAYAAVAYFRIIDRGQIRVALVSSKTKVAPLRGLSIPRLELMAALLGARLRKTVEENHRLKVKKTSFWSDSSTVCSWIKSDTRRYRQFVAFRVDEILSLSSIDEWQWISTKVNVADEATKWGKGPSCNLDSRWFHGPEFLYNNETNWTMLPEEGVDESDQELREAFVCSHLIKQPVVDPERFSRFERMLRSVAYVHHFVDGLRTPRSNQSTDTIGVTSAEIQKAERTLWLTAQSEAFPDEVAILKQNSERTDMQQKQIASSSSLVKQSPFADEFGVLREGTRAAGAQVLAYDAKFPIILPRKHRITELLLDFYHRKYGHANDETVFNEVRQKFRVPRLRVEVRLARKRCMWCRVYKATPVAPKMGPHLAVRMKPCVRPFTYVGVDIFGPYLVKIGRSVAKRWVCLFTCLTVRAVHLEVVASLSTDACKKAIRRFIARRGSPLEIYSDNGTNFVGASRELREEISKIHTELGSTFTNAQTQWKFNPPAAPHMGGCWERMVRAVKSALGSVPVVRKLDDESFATVLAEAESMVNSRPLTYIPLETADHESLTPNHFLLLSSNGVREPEKLPTDESNALRSSWGMVKHTLDNFWRRWVKEYLPTIIRRTKWFKDVRPIKVGDLVLVVDENIRNRWLRGRVIGTVPGKDGVARQAEVKTSTGVLKRPCTKLAVLDVEGSGDAQPEVKATRGGGCSPQQPLC